MVSEPSTSRVLILPLRVYTKMCIPQVEEPSGEFIPLNIAVLPSKDVA